MARTKKRYLTNEPIETKIETSYKVGIYTRLSNERRESWRNKSSSLESQEELARDYVRKNGLYLVKVYKDYEYSGTNFKRPGFEEMMQDVRNGLINCIIVKDLSRLGRDYLEMGRLIDKVFPFLGVRFISINDKLDTVDGLGEKKSFEMEIKNIVNDLYSKDISKKVTASYVEQAKKGYFLGGFAPYGYKTIKENTSLKLVKDEKISPIVDEIFKQLLEGKSPKQVSKYLDERKIAIPTDYRRTGDIYRKDGTRVWTRTNLLRLIKNPAYTGNLEQRKSNRSLSEEDRVWAENTHESYISLDEFRHILSLIESRKTTKKSSLTFSENRYRGLIFASNGKSLTRKGRRRTNKKGSFLDYWFDEWIIVPNSDNKKKIYISEKELDGIIFNLLEEQLYSLSLNDEFMTGLQRKYESIRFQKEKKIQSLNRKIQQLEQGKIENYSAFRTGDMDRSSYRTLKQSLQQSIEALQKEVCEQNQLIIELNLEYQKQLDWLKQLKKLSHQAILSKELLNALISKIEVSSGKKVTVTFKCQFDKGVSHD